MGSLSRSEERRFGSQHRVVQGSRLVCLIALGLASALGFSQDPYHSVDTRIGTANDGNTFPGASMPFGMIQWSPDTSNGWYHYADSRIQGFSLTHLSGAGCPVFADMPILPWSEKPAGNRGTQSNESLGYSHANEVAQPGYYAVTLSDGTRVELAVTERAGIARIRFAPGRHAGLLLNARGSANSDVHVAKLPPVGREHDGESLNVQPDGTITATVTSGGFCSSDTRYTLHVAFAAQHRPQTSLWQDGSLVSTQQARGKRAFAWLDLGSQPEQLVKVGLSYVSDAGAKKNLEAEIPDWNFDAVRQRDAAAWARALAMISVNPSRPVDGRIFYTALYHQLLAPSLFSDVDGQYMGFDWKVHHVVAGQHAQYANYSDWDTYRDTTPLQAWLLPDRASDMAQSLVNDAAQMGSLPRWAIANDSSYVMGGDSASILLAEYYNFGASRFDSRAALQAAVRDATIPGLGTHHVDERAHLAQYLQLGYLPADSRPDIWNISASETLEVLNADFAIGQFAKSLGDEKVAHTMLQRSENWRKLLDPETRWIRPRYADGSWLRGFDAEKSLPRTLHSPSSTDQFGFQEGNTYQYTFMLPFDYQGLFNAIGNNAEVERRLDKFFRKLVCWGEPCFNMANEPDFVTPYAYTFLGKPYKTAEVLTRIENETFKPTPGGIAGNDDLGATSGVYVWNTLGLYPAEPGLAGLVLGTPRFPHALISAENGSQLEITRSGEGIYVQSVQLNGKPWTSSWLPLSALPPGPSHLAFTMGSKPSFWATAMADRPPSLSMPGSQPPKRQ